MASRGTKRNTPDHERAKLFHTNRRHHIDAHSRPRTYSVVPHQPMILSHRRCLHTPEIHHRARRPGLLKSINLYYCRTVLRALTRHGGRDRQSHHVGQAYGGHDADEEGAVEQPGRDQGEQLQRFLLAHKGAERIKKKSVQAPTKARSSPRNTDQFKQRPASTGKHGVAGHKSCTAVPAKQKRPGETAKNRRR